MEEYLSTTPPKSIALKITNPVKPTKPRANERCKGISEFFNFHFRFERTNFLGIVGVGWEMEILRNLLPCID